MGNTWSIRAVTRPRKAMELESLRCNLSSHLCSYQMDSYCSLHWIDDNSSSRHLLIEIFVEDKSCAFVFFAFPMIQDDVLLGLNYIMIRGAFKTGILPVFHFLKSSHGCHVSQDSCRMSPFQVKQLFLEVMTTTQNDIPFKPLEVTYDTREYASSSGLDKITITIPSSSVEQVYSNVAKSDRVALFEFIDDFVMNEFRIDTRRFPIAKIGNGSLVVGCEGRIKVTHEGALDIVLRKIHEIIIQK